MNRIASTDRRAMARLAEALPPGSAQRVALRWHLKMAGRTRNVPVMEEIRTPRLGIIYDIEVEMDGDSPVDVSWHTEDEESHVAPWTKFLRQTGVRGEDVLALVAAAEGYRYDEWVESRTR